MSARHLRAVADEFAALDDSLADVRRIRRPLGDLPVTVVTHGVPVTEGVPEHLRTAVENAWQKMQAELAGISTEASLVVAERSGHNIHIEQPEIIVDAIQQVLNSRRRTEAARSAFG
jgi:pimeloyl-ACP methyl ester carboxylesterase